MPKRSSSRDRKTVAFWAFMAVALVVGAGMFWVSQSRTAPVSTAPAAEPPKALSFGPEGSENPWVYFIGDSYTGGSPMDSGTRWPAMISQDNAYFERALGVGLSGYVQRGTDGTTYLDRINTSLLQDADMVVISGGLNDVRRTPEPQIAPAVHETFARVRELAPEVPVVVLSVLAPAPDPKINRMNAVLKAEAQGINAVFLDVTNVLIGAPGSIGSDKTHPTDAGHRLLADVVGPQLPAPKVEQSN